MGTDNLLDEKKSTPEERPDDGYPIFSKSMQLRFDSLVLREGKTPLFITDAENLWNIFLENLPEEARQHYTCSACRNFVDRFGSLVIIGEDGCSESAVWEQDVPGFFAKSIRAIRDAVLKANVKGVFISDVKTLGTPQTGIWSHMSLTLPDVLVSRSRVNTSNQMMAEKSEDFKGLVNAVKDYPIEILQQATMILESETLYRSDKCLGVAQWFERLLTQLDHSKHETNRTNLIWLATATAPAGFCHIKSSMIGTLLDDIADGLSAEDISRRFAAKMNPSNYMRSQVAPTRSGIEQAEKLIEKLGIAASLRRRYAKFDEIPEFIWKNKSVDAKATKPNGIFAHLIPKENANKLKNLTLPRTVMTWEKFQKTVLPSAENIEVMVNNTNRFMALVTAADEKSENILQWDNAFSWYYHGGIDGEIKRRVESAGGRYENNEIRCSLIWEGGTDLDIHCITPAGQHIYYANKRDTTGGWLDVDANGGHITSYEPVENIRWASNAPTGYYRFYVHNYMERGSGVTPFKVELEVNGKIYMYHGTAGGTNWKKDVFTFNYIKGQHPEITDRTGTDSVSSWNVMVNEFVKVKGITVSPNLWGEKPVNHTGSHIFFLLESCKDLSEGRGRGFFNETLKPELHEIRKTLEAYMAATPIEEMEHASACGVGYSKDSEWNLIVRVTAEHSTRAILIDRFD